MNPNTRRSSIACEDGAFGPCCLGTSGTSDGASIDTIGH